MSKNLTREQAETVLREIKTRYISWIEPGYEPKLVENWEKTYESPEPTIPWAIVWYEGPDEWAYYTSVRDNDVVDHTKVHVEAATFQVLSLWPAS